jgi:acetyltransferase-like isoleucine patch superfamily enzyme
MWRWTVSRMSSNLPKLWLKINKVTYGKKLHLGGWPVIFRFPSAQITIGDRCTINSNFLSNLLGLYQRTIIVARGEGQIRIGNHVGISGSTIYARQQIEIGDDTVIGANCKIMDNDFHPLDAEDRRNDRYDLLTCKPVIIGNDVFVGCNCIILKGTSLGDRCVVGAGSVVHGTFPPDSVIAGNPARVIRDEKAVRNGNQGVSSYQEIKD